MYGHRVATLILKLTLTLTLRTLLVPLNHIILTLTDIVGIVGYCLAATLVSSGT